MHLCDHVVPQLASPFHPPSRRRCCHLRKLASQVKKRCYFSRNHLEKYYLVFLVSQKVLTCFLYIQSCLGNCCLSMAQSNYLLRPPAEDSHMLYRRLPQRQYRPLRAEESNCLMFCSLCYLKWYRSSISRIHSLRSCSWKQTKNPSEDSWFPTTGFEDKEDLLMVLGDPGSPVKINHICFITLCDHSTLYVLQQQFHFCGWKRSQANLGGGG